MSGYIMLIDVHFLLKIALVVDGISICGGSYVLDSNGDAAVITASHCV